MGDQASGDSWENRMASAAAERRAAAPKPPDPHSGHHSHYRGNSIWCSCGEFMGVFSIALTDEGPPPQRVCPTCGVEFDS